MSQSRAAATMRGRPGWVQRREGGGQVSFSLAGHCNGREQNVATKLRRDYCTGCAKGSSFLGPPQTKRSTIVRLAIQAGDDWFVLIRSGNVVKPIWQAGLLGRYRTKASPEHHCYDKLAASFIRRVHRAGRSAGSERPLRAAPSPADAVQSLVGAHQELSAVGRRGGVGAAVVVGEFVVGEQLELRLGGDDKRAIALAKRCRACRRPARGGPDVARSRLRPAPEI